MRTPSHEGLKFNAIVRGEAWLSLEDGSAPTRLAAGDCFILTQGRAFVLASDMALAPTDAGVIFSQSVDGVARAGEGETFLVMGGRMALDDSDAALLIASLPPLILIRAGSPGAERLQWLLRTLAEEASSNAPGSSALATGLMQMMFLEGLRSAIRDRDLAHTGWLGALGDPRIGASLRAVHSDPGAEWDLASLCATAGMSRSAFATRFRQVVGVAPMDYVGRWRLRLGARALRTSARSISDIASDLGYGSDTAFSNAFRRVQGASPSAYRKQSRQAS